MELKEDWNNCNPTITKYFYIDNLLPKEDAQEIYVAKEKLNSFMDRGLIKVIQKGDTDGKEL